MQNLLVPNSTAYILVKICVLLLAMLLWIITVAPPVI